MTAEDAVNLYHSHTTVVDYQLFPSKNPDQVLMNDGSEQLVLCQGWLEAFLYGSRLQQDFYVQSEGCESENYQPSTHIPDNH